MEDVDDIREIRQGTNTSADEELEIYTDGACYLNGSDDAVASIGVWFGANHDLNLSKILPLEHHQSNNTAEIYAAIEAVRQARLIGAKRICIRSDSELLVKAWNKLVPFWQINKWKTAAGKPVRHKRYYLMLIEEVAQTPGAKLRMKHVLGHSDSFGNIGADALASMAIQKYVDKKNAEQSLFNSKAPKLEYHKSIFGGNPVRTPLSKEKMEEIEKSCKRVSEKMDQIERQERDKELSLFAADVSADYLKAREYVRKMTASHNIPTSQFNDLVKEVYLDARETRRAKRDQPAGSSQSINQPKINKKPKIASEVHVRSYTPPPRK